MSVIPSAGDYLVLCDGTFSENTSAGGRWIYTVNFTRPVLFDSYTGNVANFVITNASGTNGVINVRANRANNIQVRRATIQSSTDSNTLFYSNPDSAAHVGSNLGFWDCVFKARTQSADTLGAIALNTDNGISGLYFVRCQFQRVAGGSTTYEPILINSSGITSTSTNQPHSDIGFWDCLTTDSNWRGFSPNSGTSAGLCGVAKFTFVRNNISTQTNHALLLGRDSTAFTTPKCTDVYIYGNTLAATGSNPHGLECGCNVNGATVQGNTITSTLQGIVMKGCFNSSVTGNTVTLSPASAGGTALYAKASSGVSFNGNTANVDGSSLAVFAFRENLDTATKAENTTLLNNTLNASGASATAINWGDASASNGGGVSNDNVISLTSGAALGTVRGTTVADQAALRAVWAAHGLSGDDAANDGRTIAA
jgi:ribosomal protein L35AE/L33A